jgi:diguanylate cyclase (GGDEF)-like protein
MTPRERNRFNWVLLVSAVLFLMFDSAVLGLGYWIAKQVEADAVTINISGRQRMLSQRMAKALLQLKCSSEQARTNPSAREELSAAVQLFDTTLRALDRGGPIDGGDGAPFRQPPMGGVEGRRLVEQALAVWRPYREVLRQLLSSPNDIPAGLLGQAVDVTLQANLQLLQVSNRMTSYVEARSRERTGNLRMLQIVAFVLALINFTVLVSGMWRRMHRLHGDGLKMQRLAEQDPLTGLANRKRLQMALRDSVERLGDRDRSLVLAFLDLDGFKPVNDRYGHATGDLVLCEIAKRLRGCVRRTDLIARHGGDEFVVLLDDALEERAIEQLLDKLVAAVTDPIDTPCGTLRVGVSIGAVMASGRRVTLERLLEVADRLMYRVKRGGGSRWQLIHFDGAEAILRDPA